MIPITAPVPIPQPKQMVEEKIDLTHCGPIQYYDTKEQAIKARGRVGGFLMRHWDGRFILLCATDVSDKTNK